jgi:hypothetical protein
MSDVCVGRGFMVLLLRVWLFVPRWALLENNPDMDVSYSCEIDVLQPVLLPLGPLLSRRFFFRFFLLFELDSYVR